MHFICDPLMSESPERQRMAPTHETYPLAAESDEERKDWIKSIKQVLYASVGGGMALVYTSQTFSFFCYSDIFFILLA